MTILRHTAVFGHNPPCVAVLFLSPARRVYFLLTLIVRIYIGKRKLF